MEIHFIVNPVAKNGLSLKIWKKVQHHLKQKQTSYHVHMTEGPGDAKEIATRILETTDKKVYLIAVGGDGTVHEVINGAYPYPNGMVGYIPAGSGNDFSRGFHLPKKPKLALEYIFTSFNQEHFVQQFDLGNFNDKDQNGYFVNNLGCGFDAKVAYEVNRSRLKTTFNRFNLGKLSYIYFLIKELFTYRPTEVTLQIDSTIQHFKKVWLVTVSNQPFFGGGMKISPQAKPNDGELDIIVVHNLSRLKLLLLFITIFWGGHTGLKEVAIFKGKSIKIENESPVYRHADGEYIGNGSIDITVLPHAISIITKEDSYTPIVKVKQNPNEFSV